jgi:N-acetylglucosamine-6-sulfatase
MDNLFDASASALEAYTIAGRPFKHIVTRLDALMMVLKSCKGKECHHPWSVLHPHGHVKTLKESLSSHYDTFYHEQPKVSFDSCELGYIREQEGPQNPNIYGKSSDFSHGNHLELRAEKESTFKHQGPWSIWT